MLLFRTLRCLGRRCRWVVDWADHVWVEVHVRGRGWVHLDPCEAVIDEPLLYQGWGKKQTYIIAFEGPWEEEELGSDPPFRHIEDVTMRYTSDNDDIIDRRRHESRKEIIEAIQYVESQIRLSF
mmetsp:Transcript_12311/g.26930  ORF Transcript_12311/g.26930 Transcript_12311/m.26930 type:complete len:124 (-) Transcript_12311:304-675(-)